MLSNVHIITVEISILANRDIYLSIVRDTTSPWFMTSSISISVL